MFFSNSSLSRNGQRSYIGSCLTLKPLSNLNIERFERLNGIVLLFFQDPMFQQERLLEFI